MAVSSKSPPAPAFVTPMAAQPVRALPEGGEWLYELKLDGYRALLLKNGSEIRILSRNEKDLTPMYPGIAAAGLRLGAEQAVVDGEIVALAEDGRPSFQALQHRGSHPRHLLVLYGFDLLHLNGRNLMNEPLHARRAQLPELIGKSAAIRVSLELPGRAAEVVRALRAAGIEGVIAKRRDSTYQPGERSGDWVKLKLEQQQEFVIGGYRPEGSTGVDALLIGYYEAGELQFAGKVRAGFTAHMRRELLDKLRPLVQPDCPFANLPDSRTGRWGGGVTADQMHAMRWTRPMLIAQVRFTQWTADNRLRHAAFLGLRGDKAARSNTRNLGVEMLNEIPGDAPRRGELRRADKIMGADEMREFLASAHCGRTATVGPDGYPYVVPNLFVWMDERIFLHTARYRGHFLANIEFCDRVCFEVDQPGETFPYGPVECDTAIAFRSIVVFGRIAVVPELETRRRFFSAFMSKYAPADSWGRPRDTFPRIESTVLYAIAPEIMTGKQTPLPASGKRWRRASLAADVSS